MNSNLSRNQIVTLGLVLIGLVLIPLLVVAVLVATDPSANANPQATPSEIIISDLTASTVTVSYRTEEAVEGFATATPTSGGASATGIDTRDTSGERGSYVLHHVQITGLSPSTAYDIDIISDNFNFAESASITTPPLDDSVGTPSPVFGTVGGFSTNDEGFIFMMAGDQTGNSTVTSAPIPDSGNFTLDRSNLKDPVSGERSDLDGKDLLIFATTASSGKAKEQFPGEEENLGEFILTDDPLFFSEDDLITPGSDPDPGSPDPSAPIVEDPDPIDDDPDPEPTTPGVENPALAEVNAISRGLLTQTFSSSAENTHGFAPYDVFISNVSATGFTVNWRTKQAVTGWVEIEDTTPIRVPDQRDASITEAQLRFTHSVEVSGGSIPADTVVDFTIVSGEVKFGTNVAEIAAEYNRQLESFLQTGQNNPGAGLPDAPESPESGPISDNSASSNSSTSSNVGTTAPGTTTTAPGVDTDFGFGPDAIIDTPFSYIAPGNLTVTPFEMVVPAAPDSPPIPVPLSGNLGYEVTFADYAQGWAPEGPAAAATGFGDTTGYDTDRDVIVAVRTSTGVWSSDIPPAGGQFSPSIGSALDEGLGSYTDVDDGDSLTALAFGHLNQDSSSTIAYADDETYSLTLTGPLALMEFTHGALIEPPPSIPTFLAPGSTGNLSVNAASQDLLAGLTGVAQGNSNQLLQGANQITVTSAGGTKQLSVLVNVPEAFEDTTPELPVTSISLADIPSGLLSLGVGILLMGTGVYLYRRYG